MYVGFTKKSTTVEMRTVFAAAAAAHRLNGNQYIKEDSYVAPEYNKENNKNVLKNVTVMKMILRTDETMIADRANFTLSFPQYNNLNILPEDFEFADKIIAYYQSKTFQIMTNKANEYTKNASVAAFKETLDTADNLTIGIVASLPQAYLRSFQYDQTWQTIESLKFSSRLFGEIGGKFSGPVEVLSCIYSKNWAKFFIMAKTADGNIVSFPSYEENKVGSTLVISSSRIKDYADGNVTRINYIRFSKD